MKFNKSIKLTVLSVVIAGTIKCGNTLDQVLKTAETFAGPITYTATSKLTSAYGVSGDMAATINASAALTAMELREQLRDNREGLSSNQRIKNVIVEGSKPWLVLGTLKIGLPLLNKIFQHINLPQLVTDEKVSAINAQKIVLAYVGLSKAIGLLRSDR